MAKPSPSDLKTHVENDPNGIGLSWSLENVEIRDLLNQNGYGTVQDTNIGRDRALLDLLPAAGRITGSNEEAKWARIFDVIRSVETLDPTRSQVSNLLDQAVSDGVLTQSERDAVGKRPGTYAESVWGVGVTMKLDDVREARDVA